jgi:L-ribulose-5-phosphate 3-epimerase/hexulose-6-phosphate isomerase
MNKIYRLGLYEKATPSNISWEERLQSAASAGFDYMELSIDETDEREERLNWTVAQRKDIVRAMNNAGLRLESMCLSGHRKWSLGSSDPEIRSRGLNIMHKALLLAVDLGLRTIQLAGYDVYYEKSTNQTKAWFLENLLKSVDMASQVGVCLGFETMETPFMDTVEKAMRYINYVNSPYLGVYPDIGNLTNASFLYNKSVADDILSGNGHIFAAHLKETKIGKYRDLRFGEGTTDYEGALSALIPQGVRRYVCEMWCHDAPDWRINIANASLFARTKIEKQMKLFLNENRKTLVTK